MIAIDNIYSNPQKHIMTSTVAKSQTGKDKKSASNKADMLTILVGQEKKAYRYQPQRIVEHSRYIRTKLVASLMRRQRKDSSSLVMHFPDVTPQDWELMMKYILEDRNQSSLNKSDAARLRTPFYKCGFTDGTKMCDEVLKD